MKKFNVIAVSCSFLFFIAFFFCPAKVFAGAMVVPILTESCPGHIWDTCVVQRIQSWDESPSAINPCYGWSSCYIGPDVSYSQGTGGELGNSCKAGNCIEISKLRTAKEVMLAYKEKLGIPFTTQEFSLAGPGVCVGLMYINRPSDGTTQGTLWPNSFCGKLPPPNTQCRFSLPTEIDYGTLNAYELNGQSRQIQGTVGCTRYISVTMIATSTTGERNVYLNSQRNFYSELSINGKDAYNGVKIDVNGRTNFQFGSSLFANGDVAAGAYSGTAVVLLTYN